MLDDLSTTNVLLGVIAVVQVAFLLGAVVALWKVRSALTQLQGTVRDLERDHVRPLKAQAERILGDVSRISARVEAQTARVDASVSSTLNVAERQVHRVKSAVDAVAREANAVTSGVRAVVSAVTGRGTRRRPGPDESRATLTHHTTTAPEPAAVSEEEEALHASFR